ncbi:aspartyl-phosphate phosphatase Spo0E family protein [Paenibacillus sp. PR3]|uniref:Aspartyl-phosphate phosphatase Spo0E family protein n=1 Tax=Paenibacillus terricola TaxID=2763503 RepID=A0ABR8MSV6_9BACL|nr:aspartyl-phosphate phosphatase Spo0E family protein [Paenibacillus terricola]MBD3918730.1 aspartyl-phosphate phosphatase Spo0E family protein [Paenibacillus terricola]
MNNSLYVSLEELRGRMVDTALLRNTLQDRDVLHLSQQLDTLIVQALTEQHRSRCHNKPTPEED